HPRARGFYTIHTHFLYLFSFKCHDPHRDLHSFPTRRSSDLGRSAAPARPRAPDRAPDRLLLRRRVSGRCCLPAKSRPARAATSADRKSTRLNSSHLGISYAVFCLKKKKNNINK